MLSRLSYSYKLVKLCLSVCMLTRLAQVVTACNLACADLLMPWLHVKYNYLKIISEAQVLQLVSVF